MIEKFKGTGVALATPMHADGKVDYEGLSRLIDHVTTGGVDYIVVLGTTGEAPAIYPEERIDIVNFVIAENAGKLPVVVGYSGNFTDNLVKKIKGLENSKIDGLLISSPHYNKPSQHGIVAHYKAVADVSDHPIILYNVPHRTSSNMQASTTLELANHPMIVAIKEASGDLEQCRDIIQNKPNDFLVLSGDDVITPELISMGGDGVISVVANAYPKSMSNMVREALAGKFEKSGHDELMEAIRLSGVEGNPTSVKGALKSLGLCEDHLRLPMTSPSQELVKKFQALSIRS